MFLYFLTSWILEISSKFTQNPNLEIPPKISLDEKDLTVRIYRVEDTTSRNVSVRHRITDSTSSVGYLPTTTLFTFFLLKRETVPF